MNFAPSYMSMIIINLLSIIAEIAEYILKVR